MLALYGVDSLLKNKNDKEAEQIAVFIKKHNFDAVFGGYTNKAFRNKCKSIGINVYAELGCFQGENIWKEHPKAHPINSAGEKIRKEEWYCGVCPNQIWLQNDLSKKIDRLINEYHTDGIWLDFFRYSCHWEVKNPNLYQTCFCDVCVEKFKKDLSINIPIELIAKMEVASYILKKYQKQWQEWKCRQIYELAERFTNQIKDTDPKIKVGLFSVPWMNSEYNNAIENIIGQDFSMLSKTKIDIYSPMVYHKLCYRDTKWIHNITAYFKEKTHKRIIPIIQCFNEPSTLSDDEFTSAAKIGLQSPSSGIIIFSANHIEKDNRWNVFEDKKIFSIK